MTEQKRPVLSLKRRKDDGEPVRRRKTVVSVTTPPEWKVKKQQLAEKAARDAEMAEKRTQAVRRLKTYLTLQSPAEAVRTLKPWWPALFDDDTPRLLACGIREMLFEEVESRNIPLSHKKIIRALKTITRSEVYLGAMKAGACRYDPEGRVTTYVTAEDEWYAEARLAQIRAQNRKKAELMAQAGITPDTPAE